MQQRTLGPFTVSAIGLGAMPVSMNSDNRFPSHDEAVATVRAALDAGVTLIDTADIYAPSWDLMGHNERIVADALAGWDGDRSTIVVATKGGITRGEEKDFGRDGSLDYLRTAVQKSLENLQVDVIDLYQYHRPDRWMVYGDIIQNLKTLQDEGLVRTIGISNASVEEIAIAREVLGEGGLTSVQNEFSPRHPGSYDELQYCVKHGIAFLPWSPLGGTGGGARAVGERFAAFAEIGQAHGVSPQQVVLAWELSLGETVIPIPGARRAESITDSAKAADLELSSDELARCSAAVGLEV
ncbi:aldo/keto reductase [Microbacterium sp. EYE_5]|uniref:aldo/keto reductase n=1 Tax=unclassified Microbacterium TaxID=2609290 RepID=UPI0020064F7A|nr:MULTISPECIES: aldo/keto reductase [unclassified Microbacterium]MCK6080053.1 aldo/keto reductase [Microbacterium sp. EYE_382]MCK6085324.1 aldo/keto reductase [Microbacterium sp. EYE_384]MCK6122451.1 aldo/keto reductase [Microbacterium sp. EYE_80]MCK6126087.1 aldo/keto reductase [Microbacterium sp. EYE_79]MCK6141008.1 aldo/keto reductase [Microbacterium sp. EYE_39]